MVAVKSKLPHRCGVQRALSKDSWTGSTESTDMAAKRLTAISAVTH